MAALIGGATEVSINLTVPGIVALVAGVLILLIPKLLNYIVAGYLIVVGFIQVFDVAI